MTIVISAKPANAVWGEISYGNRWPNTPSPYKYQIWRMECRHDGCKFYVEPGQFRRYDESRTEHPFPYGNLASISHARKVMREHITAEHGAEKAEGGAHESR